MSGDLHLKPKHGLAAKAIVIKGGGPIPAVFAVWGAAAKVQHTQLIFPDC